MTIDSATTIYARKVLLISEDYLLTACVLGHWFFCGNLKQLMTVGKTSAMIGICFSSFCHVAVPHLAMEVLLKFKSIQEIKPSMALKMCAGYVLISLICVRGLQRLGDSIRVSKEVLGPLGFRRRIVVISLHGAFSVGEVKKMAEGK